MGSTSPSRPGLELDLLYPRSGGSWPGRWTAADGSRVYGLFQPVDGSITVVDPASDAGLPALGRWLRAGELVVYRPTRRAVVRLAPDGAGHPRYVKVVPPGRAGRIAARHRVAEAAGADAGPAFPRLPALLEWSDEEGFVVLGAVPGRSLHAVIRGDAMVPAAHLTAVAVVLARLHRAPVSGSEPRASNARPLARWTTRIAAFVDGTTRERYEAVLAELPAPPPPDPPRLVHGDLHDGNVILGGGGAGFIDLDALGLGHPAVDVGNLSAHLVLRSLQATGGPGPGRRMVSSLVHGYVEAGGAAEEPVIVAASARSLFRLACVYLMRPRWRHVCPALLDESTRART